MLLSHEASVAIDQHILNMQQEVYEVSLAYNINCPTESNAWDGEAQPIFIFGTIEFLEIDSKSIYTSLLYMANFIRSRKVVNGRTNDISELMGFGKAT